MSELAPFPKTGMKFHIEAENGSGEVTSVDKDKDVVSFRLIPESPGDPVSEKDEKWSIAEWRKRAYVTSVLMSL